MGLKSHFETTPKAPERLRNDERAAHAALSNEKPAATYSPGRLPSEYHRRWRA